MSDQTISGGGKQLKVNTDLSRIFLWENRYNTGNFNNATYDPLEMSAGQLLGRIASTQGLKICSSAATDGSQYPVGILNSDITIEQGDEVPVAFCNYGDVAEDKIIFHNSDTLDTVVSGQSLRDRIHLMGVRLVSSDEQTGYDN